MTKKDNTLPVLAHILGLFSGFLGPLIILLVSKEKRVQDHCKLVLNWHFSLIIYYVLSIILMIILIGFLGLVVFSILNLIFSIMGAVKASEGKLWKYPLSIPFFKVK